MTDSKMREAFEKEYSKELEFVSRDNALGIYVAKEDHFEGIAIVMREAWACWQRAWQSAQSVPDAGKACQIPVVGEVVAGAIVFEEGEWPQFTGTPNLFNLPVGDYSLIIKPTSSITEAELQDLRMCKIAAREEARRVNELTAELERLRKDAERWRVVKQNGYVTEEAIDAAIAAEGEK